MTATGNNPNHLAHGPETTMPQAASARLHTKGEPSAVLEGVIVTLKGHGLPRIQGFSWAIILEKTLNSARHKALQS